MKLITLASLALAIVVGNAFAIEPLPDTENVCTRTYHVPKERL